MENNGSKTVRVAMAGPLHPGIHNSSGCLHKIWSAQNQVSQHSSLEGEKDQSPTPSWGVTVGLGLLGEGESVFLDVLVADGLIGCCDG